MTSKMPNHKHQFITSIVLMMTFRIIPIVVWDGTACEAKEIIATSQWQLIKEGDTLPAGLHIKVDLSTGEKWAKLAEGDEEGAPGGGASTSVEVRSDGEVDEVKENSFSQTVRRG